MSYFVIIYQYLDSVTCADPDTHTYLSVDATLNGPAVYGNIFLLLLQFVTFGDSNHLLHQVQSGDALCDWMFHLKPKEATEDVLKDSVLCRTASVRPFNYISTQLLINL